MEGGATEKTGGADRGRSHREHRRSQGVADKGRSRPREEPWWRKG